MSVTSPPKKSSKRPWTLGGIVLVALVCYGVPMILLGVWGVVLYRQSADELEKLGGPINTDDWPPIEVNASDMVSAYREDTAVANNKYKDKVVQVTGTVGKVEGQWVELESEKSFEGGGVDLLRVHVYFNDQDKGKVATLTKGQSITVKGMCTGKGVGDSIDVEKCVLVK
jgi:putative nucleic acid binding protein